MRKILIFGVVLCLIVIFLIGCAQKETVKEISEAELEQLSEEELDKIIAKETQGSKALVGEASKSKNKITKITTEPSNLLKKVYEIKSIKDEISATLKLQTVTYTKDSYCNKTMFDQCVAESNGIKKYDCIYYCFTQPFEDEIKLQSGKFIVIVPNGSEKLGNYKLKWMENCYPKISDYLGIQPSIFSKNIVNRFVYSPDKSYSIKTMYGAVSFYNENSIINNYIYQIKDENIISCSDILDHELTHLHVINTPIPTWLDEGLATYISYKDTDWVECQENGYIHEKNYSPYQNLSISMSLVPWSDYQKYYRTGYCFWDYLEKTYGHNKFQKIMKKLDNYRTNYGIDENGKAVFTQCLALQKSLFFLEYTVIPILEVDISETTQSKFGFGYGYVSC